MVALDLLSMNPHVQVVGITANEPILLLGPKLRKF